MTVHDEHASHSQRPERRRRWAWPKLHLVLTIALGITLVVMLLDHRQAIIGGNAVVIALVVACLLIHPLMHRGHGGRHGPGEHRDDRP